MNRHASTSRRMVNTDPCQRPCTAVSSPVDIVTETVIVCESVPCERCCCSRETARNGKMPHCIFCSLVTGQSTNNGSMCDSHRPLQSPDARGRDTLSPDTRHQFSTYRDRNSYADNWSPSTEEHLRTQDSPLTNDLPVLPLSMEQATKIRRYVAEKCGLTTCAEFMDAPYNSSIVEVSDARSEPSSRRPQDGQKSTSPVQERRSISTKDTPKDERKSSMSSKNRATPGSTTNDVRANLITQEDIENKSPAAGPIRSNSTKSEQVEKPSSIRSDSVKSEHAEKRPSAATPIRSNSKQSGDMKTPAPVKGNGSSDSAKKTSISGAQNGGRRGSIGETAPPASANETTGRRKSGSFGINATATGSNASLGEVVNIPPALAEEEEGGAAVADGADDHPIDA